MYWLILLTAVSSFKILNEMKLVHQLYDNANMIINDISYPINVTYQRYANHNSTVLIVNNEIKSYSYFTDSSLIEIVSKNNYTFLKEHKYNLSRLAEKGSNPFELLDVSPPIKNKDGIYEFFPDCYPGDNAINVFKIGIAVDYGVFLALGSNVKNVLDEVEQIMSLVRLVYLNQLHVRIDVENLYIGNENSFPPLNRHGDSCIGAIESFDEMYDWKKNISIKSNYWMELSDCFNTGVIGVSWIAGLCSSGYNYGVSNRDWITFAHELGHAFGATHSFENGVGSTGGIMDYGSGLYEGVYQFHPAKKSQMCGFISSLKYSPRYVTCILPETDICGDQIMGPTEECECIKQGQKKCGICVNCKMTKKPQCSTSNQFIMRYPSSTKYVSIYDNKPHSNCCIRNKFKGPKTLCERKIGVCDINGMCNYVCKTRSCGFDKTGCNLGCIDSDGKCKFLPVADKTPCMNGPRNISICLKGNCI